MLLNIDHVFPILMIFILSDKEKQTLLIYQKNAITPHSKWTILEMVLSERRRVKLHLPVCQRLPCCKGGVGSEPGSVPAGGRSGRSQEWAATRRSPTSCPCCCSSHGADWEGKISQTSRKLDMDSIVFTELKLCVLWGRKHTSLWASRCHSPAEHACRRMETSRALEEVRPCWFHTLHLVQMWGDKYLSCSERFTAWIPAKSNKWIYKPLHFVLLILPIVPAITGFRH